MLHSRPSELERPPSAACPSCGKPSRLSPDNPHRPFCCERCQMGDLGAWFEERYRVPADPSPDDPSDPDQ